MAGPFVTDDDLRAEINVTPLVDVVLVLLVILLVVAPMLKEEVPVELPAAANAEAQSATATPTLTIAADGGVSFEGTPLPSADLAIRLEAIYAPRADKSVMLAADRSLGYARVVEVLDACREAGIERIGIVTAPAPPRPSF
jgi:biopolymer transport protein TolR